jgi:hypothetical protein
MISWRQPNSYRRAAGASVIRKVLPDWTSLSDQNRASGMSGGRITVYDLAPSKKVLVESMNATRYLANVVQKLTSPWSVEVEVAVRRRLSGAFVGRSRMPGPGGGRDAATVAPVAVRFLGSRSAACTVLLPMP